MSYTDMKWAQKVALNFSGTYSWQFILILHTGLSSLAVSSGKQIKAEAWGLQKTAYFSNMRGICTRMEESICARDRDLWDTSIFSRGPMHNKIKNKIKPESKKNPKPPPTPLEKVQKKKSVKPQLYIIQDLCRDNEAAEQAAVIMLLDMEHFRYQAQKFSLGFLKLQKMVFLVKITGLSHIFFSCTLDIQMRSKKLCVQCQRCDNSDQEIWVVLPVPRFCDSPAAQVSLQQKFWVFWIRSNNPVSQKWERKLRKVLLSSCCWLVNFPQLSHNSIRQK